MVIHCDNQVVIYIANDPIFHEHTKHIEVDIHFIPIVVMQYKIVTLFVIFSCQLG